MFNLLSTITSYFNRNKPPGKRAFEIIDHTNKPEKKESKDQTPPPITKNHTEICQYCRMEVPFGAEICGHCRSRLRTSPIVKYLLWIIVISFLIAIFSEKDLPSIPTETSPVKKIPTVKTIKADTNTSCREFIELHSAEHVAKELDTTPDFVLGYHRINLWSQSEKTGTKGHKVGEMIPGSRALIVEKTDSDYRVTSPLDKSTGWVGKIQVKKTLWQDKAKFTPCQPMESI